MNSNDPNLFHYATKELSQDAMICWLIAWAAQGKGTGPEQEELRRCGLRFVSALLNHNRDDKDPIKLEEDVETEIHPQDRRIDVLARINRKHVLLIEDKTVTKDHSEQLSRYYDDVVKGGTQFCDTKPVRCGHKNSLGIASIRFAFDLRIERAMRCRRGERTERKGGGSVGTVASSSSSSARRIESYCCVHRHIGPGHSKVDAQLGVTAI